MAVCKWEDAEQVALIMFTRHYKLSRQRSFRHSVQASGLLPLRTEYLGAFGGSFGVDLGFIPSFE